MELKCIKENIYYIPNSTNIGVIRDGESVILIDSGLDDDTGRKILKLLNANNLKPIAIINTHSHADHCGGNAYIKEKTGAVIYAPENEAPIIQNPYFEPFFLFSGASPVNELRNKFLMAKPSKVEKAFKEAGDVLSIGPIELKTVSLPGHAVGQIGVIYKDVLFCGDFIFSVEVIQKHKIPFCSDIELQLKTMEAYREKLFEWIVPSHGQPVKELASMVDCYKEVIESVKQSVLAILTENKSTEEIFKEVFDKHQIDLKGLPQYYLMHTVMMAYLSWMSNLGLIGASVADNRLCWYKKNITQ